MPSVKASPFLSGLRIRAWRTFERADAASDARSGPFGVKEIQTVGLADRGLTTILTIVVREKLDDTDTRKKIHKY